MNGYESAWLNLKGWLETQDDYIVIPVSMVKARMDDEEQLFNLR